MLEESGKIGESETVYNGGKSLHHPKNSPAEHVAPEPSRSGNKKLKMSKTTW